MGGIGSGVWERTNSKATVEDFIHLDLWDFIRSGNLELGVSGTCKWMYPYSGQLRASVGYSFEYDDARELVLRLEFRHGGDDIQQVIPIRVSQTPDGRTVKWFCCPLSRDGSRCDRHVRKLYAKGSFFGCRKCHSLAYRSSQEAHFEERLRERFQKRFGY